MIIGCLTENDLTESRVMVSPETVKKLASKGFNIFIPKDYGKRSNISDKAFFDAGAQIKSENEICKTSDIILKITQRDLNTYKSFKNKTCILISFFDKSKDEIVKFISEKSLNIFALNYLPRITRAQSMDVLSSQANLAGYRAVIETAYEFNKVLPMMMTAAGTVTPAKYFIIGAGVAGLQAIATAKRLGAIVSATDVRQASKEQVESLGAKFIFVEDEENLETDRGYAKEVSADYKKKQNELLKETIKNQDVVICTALIPGKKAPRILNEEMVLSMKPGSVICDLATSQGGNSAFSELDKIVEKNGIKIIGHANFASRLAETSSYLLSKNILNFIDLIYDKENFKIKVNEEDDIIKGVTIK